LWPVTATASLARQHHTGTACDDAQQLCGEDGVLAKYTFMKRQYQTQDMAAKAKKPKEMERQNNAAG